MISKIWSRNQKYYFRSESSWQKLYSTILDPDELKGGVDVITNIVEGMNNMAESFGGGTKSLTGFAAMFSSLFTGPIDQALTRFITNSNLLNFFRFIMIWLYFVESVGSVCPYSK